MKVNTAVVFYYTNFNRYSFNALMGALETDEYFDKLEIFCVRYSKDLVAKLEELIKFYDKIILGLSFFTIQKNFVKTFLSYLREKFGNRVVYIAGGPHPTGVPLETLEMGFDFVVVGEGEKTFKDLLKAIIEEKDYLSVKGIYFFDNKRIVYTGNSEKINLNEYPPVTIKYNHFGPIEITRGCVFGCNYCQTSYMFGRRLRHRSIEYVVKYVKYMADFGLKDFRAITPNAFSYGSNDGKNINYEAIEKLLWNIKRIVKPGGKIFFGTFPSEVRPEHVNIETIKLILKYTDNTNLIIGAQSGSQRILNLCNRGHTVEDVFNAVEIVLKNGLQANVDFIFGLPNETEKDVEETIYVIKKLINMGAKIHAHTFFPLPQTPFANKKQGEISNDIKHLIKEYLPKGYVYGNNFKV